jgi:hypothetical protein
MQMTLFIDDINIIGTPEELPKAIDCLKKEFEMNDLRKTKLCMKLQIEQQEAYSAKILKRFYMNNLINYLFHLLFNH